MARDRRVQRVPVASDRRQGERRRGRPTLVEGEHSVSLTVSLPVSLYDRLACLALAKHTELAPLVRRLLEYSTEKSTVVIDVAHPRL